MGHLRDARVLLASWDEASAWPQAARGAVLVAFDRAAPVDAVLDLPVAVCAAQAVVAYSETFGAHADCYDTCDDCGKTICIMVDLTELAAAAGPTPEPASGVPSTPVSLSRGPGCDHAFSTQDLLTAGESADPARALRRHTVRDTTGNPLPDDELEALTADDLQIVDDAADRLAGVAASVLRMTCPHCGQDRRTPVDAGDLLWEAVALRARRLLLQVATLARAFGWTQDDVLALSTIRRRVYLELAQEMLAASGWQPVIS